MRHQRGFVNTTSAERACRQISSPRQLGDCPNGKDEEEDELRCGFGFNPGCDFRVAGPPCVVVICRTLCMTVAVDSCDDRS